MKRFEPAPFTPHPWLRNHHVQTIYGTLFPRRSVHPGWSACAEERELVLPDGDRLRAILHVHPDDPGRTRPLVVLLHGLEGSHDSHYVRGMSLKAYLLGFHSLRLNYRGCGDTEHLCSRFYNGHMVEDVDHVIREFAREAPWPIVPIGVSLGANMLLRLLATYGDRPPAGLAGAVAISPPIDFHQTHRAFQQGFNRVYDRYFLRKLKRKLRRRVAMRPDDGELAARTRRGLAAPWLFDLDQAITAPEGGFKDAYDYYDRAGTGDGLRDIRVPTLILHAEDDPLIPMAMFQARAAMIAENPALTVIFTPAGGHVGFMERAGEPRPEAWMDHFWAENQALAFVRWLQAVPHPV